MWDIQMISSSNADNSQAKLNLFGDDESRPMNMSNWSIFCDQREEPLDGLNFFGSFLRAQEGQRSLEDEDNCRSSSIHSNSCLSTSHDYTPTDSFLVHIQPNQVQDPFSLHSFPKKRSKCNCSKSRCNKDYCECFQNGEICSPETCGCMHCENSKETQVHRERLVKILSSERKGCRCKRNQCSMRYCDCKKVGDHCGPECECIGCQNKEGSQANNQQRPLRKIRQQRGKRFRQ